MIAAAESVAHLGEPKAVVAALAAVVRKGTLHEALASQDALDVLRGAGLVSATELLAIVAGQKFREPADRIPGYWSDLSK